MNGRGSDPVRFADPEALVDAIVGRVGHRIVLGLPLGLGKACHVVNTLFARARRDPGLSLTILTALTLELPVARHELARRFLAPVAARFFAGYPALDYAQAMHRGTLPANICVREFYFQPGTWLDSPLAQRRYQSINYSEALEVLLQEGMNVLAQLIAVPAAASGCYSLSCNPDLSVDLFEARRRGEVDFLAVGQVNASLPFMTGEAERPLQDWDMLLQGGDTDFPLFMPPHQPVTLVDHAIGLHAATLVPDGGTLQVGIGSIGDAVCHGLLLRHQRNRLFRDMLQALNCRPLRGLEPFERGLYGLSEMLVEGLLQLIEAGIIKRRVDGSLLHAGFFVGSPGFYRRLEALAPELRSGIAMMPISFTNRLYGNEEAKRRARVGACFVNSGLKATLMGAVVSDGLEDGRVVSGVGGQYDFTAQAHALKGARSVITLRATRTRRGRTESNIRWRYAHLTLPRHLRDTVVTEYGIAELRGRSDEEVIARMLNIADSRFQPALLRQAKAAGKIAADYRIPEQHRHNSPQRLLAALGPAREEGVLGPFPLGSDLSIEEEQLAVAMTRLEEVAGSPQAFVRLLLQGLRHERTGAGFDGCLERMRLGRPRSFRERVYRLLLLAALAGGVSPRNRG